MQVVLPFYTLLLMLWLMKFTEAVTGNGSPYSQVEVACVSVELAVRFREIHCAMRINLPEPLMY